MPTPKGANAENNKTVKPKSTKKESRGISHLASKQNGRKIENRYHNTGEDGHSLISIFNTALGLGVMVTASVVWSNYLITLHENNFWFTNIKEVEREISFRTEQGFYYSFFKTLVNAPSITEGMDLLRRDEKSEHGRVINDFERFNIHQELFLALLYKFVRAFSDIRPILFYVYSIFALQGVFLSVIFLLAWRLGRSWVAGALATAFIFVHRTEITRVEFTIPLREHFSLPFIFGQYVFVGIFLASDEAKDPRRYYGSLASTFATTFFAILFWQFGQFVLLLEGLVLFGLAVIGLLDRNKVAKLFLVQFSSVYAVWYFQFYQPMVMISLFCTLVPVAILLMYTCLDDKDPPVPGLLRNLAKSIGLIVLSVCLTFGLNQIVKVISGQEADNHIFTFVKRKFGLVDENSPDNFDFETQLYLCLAIFQPLEWRYFVEMSKTGALPFFAAFTLLEIGFVAFAVFQRWSSSEAEAFMFNRHHNPEWCFHLGNSVALSLLALSTMRMKCFLGPYLVIFAAALVLHKEVWSGISGFLIKDTHEGKRSKRLTFVLRHAMAFALISLLYLANRGRIYEELEDLREFYDPDTVELMEWIPANTPPDSAFTGSMQLMAGIKLCTARPITNHPHFEDKELRLRTKELYQIYGKKSAEEVWKILREKYDSSYIILEDSICMRNDRCGTPSIMDVANGHIPEDGKKDPDYLIPSEFPRFCKEVRHQKKSYSKFFKKVFENKTFKIYKVLPLPT